MSTGGLRVGGWKRGLALLVCGFCLAVLGPASAAADPREGFVPCFCELQALSQPVCVDFERLAFGARYIVGDYVVDSGAVFGVQPFVLADGTFFSGGRVTVAADGLAGGSGQELLLNNVTLSFDLGGPLTGLSLRFGEYGGNLNFEINGEFYNVANFADLNGLTLGGVLIRVTEGLGHDAGTLRLAGPLHTLRLGGQELALDEICPETDCVDMEDLAAEQRYFVGDVFLDSGIPMRVAPFLLLDGTVVSNGYAQVDARGLAGGWGKELQLNNALVSFGFSALPRGMAFDFGEYGGTLNLLVNGEFRRFVDWADLDGQLIGGAQVAVVLRGGGMGRVHLSGQIRQLAIGGQELWIDNLCPAVCCVPWERLGAGVRYNVGQAVPGFCGRVQIEPFTLPSGAVISNGYALTETGAQAGGSGVELQLNSASLALSWETPAKRLRLVFGEYGGNVNLRVNGVMHNVANLAQLHGTTIGGVAVSVANGQGNDKGRLILEGRINSVGIGGQELYLDDVCADLNAQVFFPLLFRLGPHSAVL
ncbi:MAG: hypothetical protein H5T69_14750 [Chloroflexi bacterium]|nr:hypothetical protein [Chloroflexota bacterium]